MKQNVSIFKIGWRDDDDEFVCPRKGLPSPKLFVSFGLTKHTHSPTSIGNSKPGSCCFKSCFLISKRLGVREENEI